MLPVTAPHKAVDMEPLNTGEIWKNGNGKIFFVRWTSDFDCGYETAWWYCIKDTVFDINELKAKRRYEINKGKKNFDVRIVDPSTCVEELYQIQTRAFEEYPSKYRPKIAIQKFRRTVDEWKRSNPIIYVAYERNTRKSEGFAVIIEHEDYAQLSQLKTNPVSERLGINAAIVAKICEDYNYKIATGRYYLSDGERSIYHETRFQDYLEKYFGFRKAYAQLHIKYCCGINIVVHALYPFRRLIKKGTGRLFGKIYAVLLMEECTKKRNIKKGCKT